MSTIAEIVVAKWHKLKADEPRFQVELQPGVEEEKIAEWEAQHKVPLPEALKSLYRLANGQKNAGAEYPTTEIGLFGDHLSFVQLEVGKDTPILGYAGGEFEAIEYLIGDLPPFDSKIPDYVNINDTPLKLVDTLILGCCLQEEHSFYYVLLFFAQSNKEIVYDVVLYDEQESEYLQPFGIEIDEDDDSVAMSKAKPSKNRFDDWLSAYEQHLTENLETFFLTNSKSLTSPKFSSFNRIPFSSERFQKTKSAAK